MTDEPRRRTTPVAQDAAREAAAEAVTRAAQADGEGETGVVNALADLLTDLRLLRPPTQERLDRVSALLAAAGPRWRREGAVSARAASVLSDVEAWVLGSRNLYPPGRLDPLRTRLRDEALSALAGAPTTLESTCSRLIRCDPREAGHGPLRGPVICFLRHLEDPGTNPDPGGLLLAELLVGMVREHAERWSRTGTVPPDHVVRLICVRSRLAECVTEEGAHRQAAVDDLLDALLDGSEPT